MKRRRGRKLFSLLLIAAMVLSLSGIIAFATESNTQAGDEASEETEEQSLSFKSSKVSKTTADAPFTNKLSGVVGKVTYTSSKKSVATVDQNGKVTIVGTGTATIKATDNGYSSDEEGTASFTLTVSKPTETASASEAAEEDSEEDVEADEADEKTGESDEDGGTVEDEDVGAVNEEDVEAEDEEDVEAADEEDVGAVNEEDVEAEDEEDVEAADEEDVETEDEEDVEAEDEEDVEAEDEEDVEAEDEEDVEAEDEEDVEAGDVEDVEAEDEEDVEAEDEEDVEAEDEEDVEAEDEEDIEDVDEEADEAEDIDEEDGDEADSLIMEEPLLAEMTGMTVSYYSTAAAGKEEQDLSFDAGNTVNKEVSSAPFINPLNGAVGDVEYSSSNESVASVDGNGIVTINGAGNTIITAEVSETADYKEGTASYLAVISEESEEGSESTVDSQHKDDTMNIRVALAWEGDTESMRPESVEIALLADGSEKYTTSLTESGGWNHTWTDLPVYSENNVKIEYTVKEKVVPSGYTAGYGDWFDEENDTYSIVITDTWGVESDTSGVNGPKTSDVNFWVLYLYLAVLAGSSIMLFGMCRRAPRR